MYWYAPWHAVSIGGLPTKQAPWSKRYIIHSFPRQTFLNESRPR